MAEAFSTDPMVAHAQAAALWHAGTKMRNAQRAYFTQGRTKDHLIASKIAEREFDVALLRMEQLLRVGRYSPGLPQDDT